MYFIGMVLSVVTALLTIQAARSVYRCGKELPITWGLIAISQLLFCLDSIPNIGYTVYFGMFFIVMSIASGIAWEKSKN
jgi:hypothetical protein